MSSSLAANPRPRTILVVEDEPAALFLLSHFLQERGFSVLGAGSADEGIELLTRDPAIAAVFTDVRLPGMNGHSLALWVRERYPEMPIIVGSGSALAPALALGENYSFFVKPYDFDQIAEHIHALLAQNAGR